MTKSAFVFFLTIFFAVLKLKYELSDGIPFFLDIFIRFFAGSTPRIEFSSLKISRKNPSLLAISQIKLFFF